MVWGESEAPVVKPVYTQQSLVRVWHGRVMTHSGIWSQRHSKPLTVEEVKIPTVRYFVGYYFCLFLYYQDRVSLHPQNSPYYPAESSNLTPTPACGFTGRHTGPWAAGGAGSLKE